MKIWAKPFYNSKAWKQCRLSYISKVHGLCEHCMKNSKLTPGYIVDHIVELTPDNITDVEISLNHSNLQYLCLVCHNKKTFDTREDVTVEGLMFNERGELVQS